MNTKKYVITMINYDNSIAIPHDCAGKVFNSKPVANRELNVILSTTLNNFKRNPRNCDVFTKEKNTICLNGKAFKSFYVMEV